jgi:hypothetical protein
MRNVLKGGMEMTMGDGIKTMSIMEMLCPEICRIGMEVSRRFGSHTKGPGVTWHRRIMREECSEGSRCRVERRIRTLRRVVSVRHENRSAEEPW